MADETILRQFLDKDLFAKHMGIELIEMTPGCALTRLVIGDCHRNGAGVVHGGAIFSLADFAFAAASNSHGQLALGINVAISFLKATRDGTLFARAEEISFNPKLATYQVRVFNENDETLAIFQGTVYRKRDRIDEL
ncbi:PaaI family thioesterase [Rhodoferax sp. 4810]|uniref:PaaI family thioesterase n=1 Tax=Thiospirillum jenense TaxID=1653858 RepID=A0A839HEA6_9GAMM|nr:PaaI family thioesterase [Thiospirillum jenense]MBB1073374.1 PaaI family thioesterase [Rhodoferax jenense]MBB1125726.1 PaaI family thioesterase [Thiospirillum jenense]